MKIISEGAEAKIYESATLGNRVVIKDRAAKAYREKSLDLRIRAQRTKSEAKILAKASSNGANTPTVLMVGSYTITMSKLSGRLLSTMVDNAGSSIITEAGRQLAILHKAGIAHGDYTPANIMVSKKHVYVIDFGLSEMTNSVEEKALDVLLMKRSLSKSEYATFVKSYSRSFSGAPSVLARLREIEIRGRYQTRTLLEA